MLRNVYLEGELGLKYGKEFQIEAESPKDVFQCLDGNYPGFKHYMVQCHDNDVGFHIEVGGEDINSEEELLLNLEEGDILITPVPAGSKSGGAKILAAIAIVAIVYFSGGVLGLGSAAGSFGATGATAGTMTFGAQLAVGLAINLALTGIQQLMAPDPGVDSDADESYLFNGSSQNIVEGDPVPVLYGELKVPGMPISFEVLNRKFTGATNMSASSSDYTVINGIDIDGTSINN